MKGQTSLFSFFKKPSTEAENPTTSASLVVTPANEGKSSNREVLGPSSAVISNPSTLSNENIHTMSMTGSFEHIPKAQVRL